jgi:hypothetical protein
VAKVHSLGPKTGLWLSIGTWNYKRLLTKCLLFVVKIQVSKATLVQAHLYRFTKVMFNDRVFAILIAKNAYVAYVHTYIHGRNAMADLLFWPLPAFLLPIARDDVMDLLFNTITVYKLYHVALKGSFVKMQPPNY